MKTCPTQMKLGGKTEKGEEKKGIREEWKRVVREKGRGKRGREEGRKEY